MIEHYDLDIPKNPNLLTQNFTHYEFTTEELGFPSYQEIYQSVKNVEESVGVKGWRILENESKSYGGFSLTHNPNYKGSECSVYHQTLGDPKLITATSEDLNRKANSEIYDGKDSYYDTYGFTSRLPIIEENFGSIFKRIDGAIMRSRVSYLRSEFLNFDDPKENWHIDEYGWQMIRVVIPVKTSDNFIIRIHGEDGIGNKVENLEFAPKLGKVYMWNNRIPHQMHAKEVRDDPRIYVIIGFNPWFNFIDDKYVKNENWGIPIQTIVRNKLFLN